RGTNRIVSVDGEGRFCACARRRRTFADLCSQGCRWREKFRIVSFARFRRSDWRAGPFVPDQKRRVISVGGGTDISSQSAAAVAGKMAWIDGCGVALSPTLCRLARKREIAPRIPDKSADYPRDAQIFRRTRLYRSGNADDASGAG